MYGHKVSNSYNHTKRTWRPNIHKVKAIVDGTTRTINMCANCIRSDYIDKKVRIPKDVRMAFAEQDKKAAETATGTIMPMILNKSGAPNFTKNTANAV